MSQSDVRQQNIQETEPVFDVIYRVSANVLAVVGLVSAFGAVGFYLGFFYGGAK